MGIFFYGCKLSKNRNGAVFVKNGHLVWVVDGAERILEKPERLGSLIDNAIKKMNNKNNDNDIFYSGDHLVTKLNGVEYIIDTPEGLEKFFAALNIAEDKGGFHVELIED